VEVLLLHRHLPRADVLAGLAAATAVGATSPDVVAIEARRIAERRGANPRQDEPAEPATQQAPQQVVSLTERRLADPEATIASLPADRRPPPSVTAYDQLLSRRHATEPPEQTTSTGDAS
jgi:hypothetical protein